METFYSFLVLLSALALKTAAAINCYACENVRNASECSNVSECHEDEICFTEVTGQGSQSRYKYGCKAFSLCHNVTTATDPPGHIVGRGLDTPGHIVGRGLDRRTASTTCNKCCNSNNLCNTDLCTQAVQGPSACADQPQYNCALINSTFGTCLDIHHAKLVCRKYCHLCGLVDGGLSEWSMWSLCDNSCGQSHRTRRRTCSNPTPANGGLNCVGDTLQSEACHREPCPINGGWSTWHSWGGCSKTCGVGLESRTRGCDHPVPVNGLHCFGDAMQDRVCFKRSCNDGAWSSWSPWGGCSATCNGGLMSRSRQCNNPTPSSFGKGCQGNTVDYATCNTKACQDKSIFFTATTPTGHLLAEGNPQFSLVPVNTGNGYNEATGVFTCRIPGIYQFFVTLVANQGRTQCSIRKNRATLVYAITTAINDWKSASASTYVHCGPNDVIDLPCGGWDHVDHNASTMFSGALVAAD